MLDVCYLIYKKAFPMLLITVATRIAKLALDPSVVRTLVCQSVCFSFLLFAFRLSEIEYEQHCIVHTVPKIHMNWTLVSIVGLGFYDV